MGAASSTGITPGSGLTVAVTGPTGEIGKPFVRALEVTPEVGRVLAMARRPFDPRELGWSKTEYRQGDILDRAAVDELVADADVVVHLAFIVVKATAKSYDINIEGSRNVFDATVAAGVPRLVYTSSVAAYGYHDHDGPLTEEMPTRGTERHAYSHQKAEVERVLHEALTDAATDAYVFRPCVVAGPEAPALLDQLPYLRLEHKVPAAALRAAQAAARRQAGPARSRRAPSSSSTTTMSPRPWWRVCWGGASRASTTSRGPARSDRPTSPRSSAGTPSGFPGARST